MAFHVACPITCRRICFCPLGFPRSLATAAAKASFLDEVIKVHDFLRDPDGIRARNGGGTVQVAVPRIAAPPPPPVAVAAAEDESAAAEASAQAKRVALQRKAAADMVAAEDFARRFESGNLSDTSKGVVGDEQGLAKVMCRICFSGENEGNERARRMLPCKTCGKKYHRNCVKSWGQHRDLFHWSSWSCPSCRICEVCRRTGDPNKLMFCKRCDRAYHCYCQRPSHKNVSAGVYVCPDHTKCHSCDSIVAGKGSSVRWFLGYTCCDACGQLFVKGNYCPVCLKVYRDSEATPMVCCDLCQRWVHCHCDGISDAKYQQFQVDNNLQYKCATCRGECYQVKNHEDASKELWKRKDEVDRDLISWLNEQRRMQKHSPLVHKQGSHKKAVRNPNKRKHGEDEEDSPSQFISDVVGKKLKGVSHLEPPSTKGFINVVQQQLKSLGGLDFGEKPKKERIFMEQLRALYSLYCVVEDDLDECEKLNKLLEESKHRRGELEYALSAKDGEVVSAHRKLHDLQQLLEGVEKEAALVPDLKVQLREVNERKDQIQIEAASQKCNLEILQVKLNAEKRKVTTMEKEAVVASFEFERRLKLEYMRGYDDSINDLVSRGLLNL